MGVYGLEYFMENKKPNTYCYSVDIKDLADAYKTRSEKKPTIVIDGANALRNVLRRDTGDLYWILGGQMKELVEHVQMFVSSFQKIGIDVVFFFNGATPEDKRSDWIRRRNANVKDVVKNLENISTMNNPLLPEMRKRRRNYSLKFLLPPLIGGTARFTTQFECGCETHFSLDDDDYEIAEYARKNDCFAILTQDSDFIFHKGNWHYLSAKHLNLNTMKTLIYDKVEFQKYLGLHETHEMLLFATLMGNDIISYEKLAAYHEGIAPGSSGKHWLASKRVSRIVQDIKENFTNKNFTEVSTTVFGNEKMEEDIQKSFFSYSREPLSSSTGSTESRNWDSVLEKARQLHVNGILSTHMYPVMAGEAYELSIALEPYNTTFQSTAEIYQPLRSRLYAVLLHEKSNDVHVKEWCITTTTCPTVPDHVVVSKIPNLGDMHPGQLVLMNDETSPDIKWKLFVECLTVERKLNVEKLKQLGLPYAVPVAVLFYLYEEQRSLLGNIDMDAILAHVAVLQHYTAKELRRIDIDLYCPEVKEKIIRFIRVSTIYHRGITTVLFLLSACGLSLREAMPSQYYDGKLLLKIYLQGVTRRKNALELCENKEGAYQLYKKMKSLVASKSEG